MIETSAYWHEQYNKLVQEMHQMNSDYTHQMNIKDVKILEQAKEINELIQKGM